MIWYTTTDIYIPIYIRPITDMDGETKKCMRVLRCDVSTNAYLKVYVNVTMQYIDSTSLNRVQQIDSL